LENVRASVARPEGGLTRAGELVRRAERGRLSPGRPPSLRHKLDALDDFSVEPDFGAPFARIGDDFPPAHVVALAAVEDVGGERKAESIASIEADLFDDTGSGSAGDDGEAEGRAGGEVSRAR